MDNTYAQVRITAIQQETDSIKTFTLCWADGSPIAYEAGQFVTFIGSTPNGEIRRSYSVSTSPALAEPLSVTVKRIDNGVFSRLLTDRATVGTLLHTSGVGGMFTLQAPQQAPSQHVFFAAGIGITPVFSLLKQLLYTHPNAEAVLIYSNTHVAGTCFYEALQQLATAFAGRLRIVWLFSDSFNLLRARLSKENVPTLLRELHIAPQVSVTAYLCGPFAYMRMVTYALEEIGFTPEQIRREYFNPQEHRAPVAAPPDTDPHTVTLLNGAQTTTVNVQYPETILRAGKRVGLQLPYSCETGRCGSCVALKLEGEVWLQNNEVLTANDLASGKILTCQAFAVGGDAVIRVG